MTDNAPRYSFERFNDAKGNMRGYEFFDHTLTRVASIGMSNDLEFAAKVVTALNTFDRLHYVLQELAKIDGFHDH